MFDTLENPMMKQGKKRSVPRVGFEPGKIIKYIILIFWFVVTIYPLYFTLISSVKTQNDLYSNIFGLPKQVILSNYVQLFMSIKIQRYMTNSLLISCCAVFLQIIICSMASFVLSRFHFKGKNALTVFFLAGMLIPSQSVLIPLTVMADKFNGFNNYPFIIAIYITFGISLFVFILTSFMKGIPGEIEEAAIMDGCSPNRLFWRIILPLSMPSIASASIISFFGAWNDLLIALILLKDDLLKTVPLCLVSFTGERFTNYTGQFAAVIVSILPTMILYFLMQKTIIKGMTAGSVKG